MGWSNSKTASVVVAELGVDGPGGMGVVVDRGGDRARPSCSKLARGFTSLTGTAGPPPTRGLAVTFRSERAKLPLEARPGPFFLTIDSCPLASTRSEVRPRSGARASKV